MFGYIRPCRPELKIKDDAFFKSYYCGVCKALGKCAGPVCRMLLQYDLVFLSVLHDGIKDDCTPSVFRCPFKLRRVNAQTGASVTYAAEAHILLSAAKLKDDRQDGRKDGLLAGAILTAKEKRIAEKYPVLQKELSDMLREQKELEDRNCTDPDEAAEPFARFCAQLFSLNMPENSQPSLRFMGYNIGKWIYWTDALDDYDKDAKKGSYNVWRLHGFSREEAAKWALPIMQQCISQAQLCYDLLEGNKTSMLIENILNEGMPRVMDAVAEGRRMDDGSL